MLFLFVILVENDTPPPVENSAKIYFYPLYGSHSENSDISMYANIKGFLTYRCILTSSVFRLHDGVALMMPFCLEYHLLRFHQLPPKLILAPRPLNISKSYIFIAFMSSHKPILLDYIKKQAKKSKKGQIMVKI